MRKMDSKRWRNSGRREEMMMGNEGGEEEEGGGAGAGVEACEDCTYKCMMLHGRKGPSPSVASFFKIMFGDDFHSLLFVPPKFSQAILSLVEQKVFLHDSNGKSWSVKLSTVDGRLAFEQGWNRFVSDHSIEIGDFLVFNYLTEPHFIESHFIVQIYGKSGCEKLNFSEGSNTNKAKQVGPKSGLVLKRSERQLLETKRAPFCANDEVSINNQESCSTSHFNSDQEIFCGKGSSQDMEEVLETQRADPDCDKNEAVPQSMSYKGYDEVPFYLINRNVGHEETLRYSFFDLSNFEMVEGKNGVKGLEAAKDKTSPDSNIKLVQSNTSFRTNCLEGIRSINLQELIGKRRACIGTSIDVQELEEPGRKFPSENGEKVPDKVSKHGPPTSQMTQNTQTLVGHSTEKDSPTEKDRPPGISKIASGTCSKMEHAGKLETHLQSPTRNASVGKSNVHAQKIITNKYVTKKDSMTEAKSYQYEKKLKICKEEPVEHMNEPAKKLMAIKRESKEKGYPSVITKGNTCRIVRSEAIDVIDFSISVCVASQTHLELPMSIHFPSFLGRGKPRLETKIILLRDPKSREWPVLLHEKHGNRIIGHGWADFSKANAIGKGDICILNLKDETECLFEVQISRSEGF